ncbi:MAG: hypothetical protein FWD48_11770 [Oscillospiraceae bacterium]|nr:hypothetical protein [Oscillospiraceae bacterium]
MKKLFTLIFSLIIMLVFTITAFADVPAKKTQIDWLISGAGGDVVASGGDINNATGEFSYDFTNEDGSISGRVAARSGVITITGGDAAVAFAEQFTQHFATLTRTGHFHATHRLSGKSTEEFPVEVGSFEYMTFCYDADENGGMMNAIIFERVVKFVSNLSNGGFAFNDDEACELDSQAQSNPKTSSRRNYMLIPVLIACTVAIAADKRRKK